MKKAILLVATFLLLLFACTTEKQQSFLTIDNIRTQTFSIDPVKENRIVGARGGIFTIPAGAFDGTESVTIELKEVYSPIEILAAGLTTESNGQLLESGGMFYMNAKRDGKELELKKEINGSIPANYINDSMKLFTGEVKDDGSVNWVDPAELSNMPDSNAIRIETGKRLFRANCFSCHSVFEKLTGPALANTDKKYTRQDYYKLISNPAAFGKENDYFACEIKANSGVLMTGFPGLGEEEIDCIIKYINNEAKKRPDLIVESDSSFWNESGCNIRFTPTSPCGSNTIYIDEEFQTVVQNAFANFNGSSLVNEPDSDTLIIDTSIVPTAPIEEDRYNFKINTLGWFNIDILMKELPGITDVFLEATSNFKDNSLVEVKLYFPEKKIALNGNYNATSETFTFGNTGNRIPLFIGDLAIIFCIAEMDGKTYYDVQEFRIKQEQKIQIKISETTKEALEKAFEKINLDNINLDRLTKKPVVVPIPCNDSIPAK